MVKATLRTLAAIAMMAMGTLHFILPDPFVHIVPAFMPAPLVLVYVSGLAEIAGGVGLLWSRTRKAAAWGLVALYIAVFPANINMAINAAEIAPNVPAWALVARLPLQIVLVALAVWFAQDAESPRPTAVRPA